MMTSQIHHADVININIRVSHMGRVNWYSGWVCPSGRRRRVGRIYERGQPPRRRVRACPTFDFHVIFTSGFVSSSSTQWYGQNTILTTFIFEQKIKHHFKPYATIPIVGDSGSPLHGLVMY
jgi:hypothetical protein